MACPQGKVMNPATGRCVKVGGTVYLRLKKENKIWGPTLTQDSSGKLVWEQEKKKSAPRRSSPRRKSPSKRSASKRSVSKRKSPLKKGKLSKMEEVIEHAKREGIYVALISTVNVPKTWKTFKNVVDNPHLDIQWRLLEPDVMFYKYKNEMDPSSKRYFNKNTVIGPKHKDMIFDESLFSREMFINPHQKFNKKQLEFLNKVQAPQFIVSKYKKFSRDQII